MEHPILSYQTPGPTPFRTLSAEGRMAIPIGISSRLADDEIIARPRGAKVRRGEILVERWPESCAAPLAPADGRIVGIGVARITGLLTVPAVLFEADAATLPPDPTPLPGPESIRMMLAQMRGVDLSAGIEKLRKHGVSVDRWTSPDLIGQLQAAAQEPIDSVLCNVLDESPDLLLNAEVAGAWSMELAAGVLALARLTGAKRVWAVLAAFDDPAVWEALRYAAAGTDLKIVPLRDHYPQAHPSLLIHEITGRHTRFGRLTTEARVLTLDAPAAVAVGRCFLDDAPMLSVPVGVYDKPSGLKHWLDVPVGVPWSRVLEYLSISESQIELRAGNPLREKRLSADCIVSSPELSVTATLPAKFTNPDPCIRCAWCVEGCPVRIQPAGLLEAAQQDDPYMGDQYGLDACIECGICSYVCPSHLPVLAGIRALRISNERAAGKKR
jgi:Na+-translocating ferredoxin:NAD+ oxidoreductase RnfC subunit